MKNKIMDAIGISAAVLCLIHCIIFPLLMVIPLGISHNPYIDLFFLITGAIVVMRIIKKVNNRKLRALFWLSLLLIAVSVFTDLFFEFHLPLIYIGAAGLITAHIINFRSHRHH